MIEPLATKATEASPVPSSAPPTSASTRREIASLLGKPARRPMPGAAEMAAAGSASPNLLPMIALGRVIALEADGRALLCLANGFVCHAHAAASCLLRPEAGDLASLVLHDERAWLTAILERDPALPATIELGASALAIRARRITLESDTELKLAAHQLSSRATVSVSVCGDRYANVAGTDSTQAHCTLVRTAGHMGLHAGNASITAEALIKVDAGQVHMG